MNDHDAMTAINEILDGWLKIEYTAVEALHAIVKISEANQNEPAEARK